MGGEGVEAEEAEAERDEPIGKRRFFEVTDAVDAESDEIASEGHVAGGAGVGGVGVVEQWRGKERGEEDDQPETAEEEQSGGATGSSHVVGCGEFGGCCEEGWIDHEFVLLFQNKWVEW
jgi:hypothetical protein